MESNAQIEDTEFEEIKPVTETKPANENADLLSRMQQITERKEPSKTTSASSSFNWDEDDFEAQPQPKKTATPEKKAEEEPAKVTDKAKKASARTLVGMMDFTQKTILTPILNAKFKKKFSPEEVDRLDNVIDADPEKLFDDRDKSLKSKWDRLAAKLEKKKASIPFTDTEKSDMESFAYDYFDAKETSLGPEWGIAFSFINIVGKRVIDVVFDD
jgi:hypothetical protein